MDQFLTVALAQISPVWLHKNKTIEKIKLYIVEAALKKCNLIVFGEGLVPGYPFWLSITNGAAFNNPIQKKIHAHYIQNSIQIESGDLDGICVLAKEYNIAIYLGIIERAANRGGHSLYCSLVYINEWGEIKSVHRKLQPTYEERLVWSPGDGNGLQVHPLKQFSLGGLNCWENWMPLPRMALYAMGENVHVATWPGSNYNTEDITRFIAKESRSFVLSVSSLLSIHDIPDSTPFKNEIVAKAPEIMANGGSCIAGPDGEWIITPVINKEGLLIETLDINLVFEERQNFDLAGHYSRPDVTKLIINNERQSVINTSG